MSNGIDEDLVPAGQLASELDMEVTQILELAGLPADTDPDTPVSRQVIAAAIAAAAPEAAADSDDEDDLAPLPTGGDAELEDVDLGAIGPGSDPAIDDAREALGLNSPEPVAVPEEAPEWAKGLADSMTSSTEAVLAEVRRVGETQERYQTENNRKFDEVGTKFDVIEQRLGVVEAASGVGNMDNVVEAFKKVASDSILPPLVARMDQVSAESHEAHEMASQALTVARSGGGSGASGALVIVFAIIGGLICFFASRHVESLTGSGRFWFTIAGVLIGMGVGALLPANTFGGSGASITSLRSRRESSRSSASVSASSAQVVAPPARDPNAPPTEVYSVVR